MNVIRVAIVEDRKEIRENLSLLIGSTPGFLVSDACPTMEEGLLRISSGTADIALIDLGLPGMSGIEGIRILKNRWPSLPTLVLTVYDDDARIFDALCAGACGYLLKKTPQARLLESIQEVLGGGAPMSPEVARRVIDLFRAVRPPEKVDYDLSPHETRLLKLLVEGHNYKTAGKQLGVTVNTISYHMRRIYDKLQVHSKSEAVSKALRDRLV